MENISREMSLMRIADEIAVEMMDDSRFDEEDLKSEAYLGLAEAIHDLGEEASDDAIEDAIRAHMLKARAEADDLTDSDNQLIERVAELNECIEKLTAELGTKPNFDEIANAMGMSQDTVLAVLELTGEDVDQ